MQEILAHIDRKTRDFAAIPFLAFLKDQRIDPRLRLSFAPCMAPWVMGFADLNKYVFRDDASDDPFQKLINAHTRVDDDHWLMFIKDLRTLGVSDTIDLAGALRLLWGDESHRSRKTVYGLTQLSSSASPTMRLVLIETVEAAGAVGLEGFGPVARDFHAQTGKRLLYFGDAHEALESGHLMGTESIEAKLSEISLTPEQRAEARVLVDRVFELLHAMGDELLAYARNVIAQQAPDQVPHAS